MAYHTLILTHECRYQHRRTAFSTTRRTRRSTTCSSGAVCPLVAADVPIYVPVSTARNHMRRSSRATPVVAAWLAAATTGGAQTPRGAMLLRVADANDSTLAGAAIVLPALDVTFAVPVGGNLLIRDVKPGTYIVQARRLGYVE